MRLITANIGRKQNPQQTRHDIETLKLLRGVIGFQEIDEDDSAPEHAYLKSVLGPKFSLHGMETFEPIAVPDAYEVISSDVVFGTDGIKHYSPTRFFTVVQMRVMPTLLDKATKRNEKKFVVINTHYPAGGYIGERPKAVKKALINHWDEQFDVHKRLVKKYADQGITVFWTGDVNRVDMPKTHAKEVRVVTAGIDSISYIRGNLKVDVTGQGNRKLFSDHDAHFIDFRLSL